MKNSFVIITENTCDLSQEYIERNNIVILPITYTIGNEVFDGTYENSLPPDEFYRRLKLGEVAVTSEPSIAKTMDCYLNVIEQGQNFLHISFSSELAKCYKRGNSAIDLLKEEGTDFKGYCIDSKSASLGQGLLVDLAVSLRKRGKSLEKTCAILEERRNNLCHYITVESLDYLFRGGRLTKTSKIMGSIFSIKPIIHMNEEGKLVKIDKVHGRKASLDELITKLALKLSNDVECPYIYIAHANCLKEAEQVKQLIFNKYKLQTKVINNIGPIIGAHTGPGALALFFFGSDRTEEVLVKKAKELNDK